ncbi:putative ATP-dependent RNA helicase TDRD12 isoform X1 [Daphnia magna]|uniref:putative ATP-dependent RNA helicase TDRD12 isoform X1 n=2 Tax=Daphnia magna TaxID=35525 RepID=UPI001E1BB38B|nr:putative ATP-dependent RNA helicase TDRD12 isoform X1 [Daphnia magna]
MQSEENKIYTIGFSDYVRHYETLLQLKKARLSAEKADGMASRRDGSLHNQESSSCPRENVHLSPQEFKDSTKTCPLNSSANGKFSFARGRSILAISEYLNSCQSKKNQTESLKQCVPISQPVKFSTTVANLKPQQKSNLESNSMPPDQNADITGFQLQTMNSIWVSQSPNIKEPVSKNESLSQILTKNCVIENQPSKQEKATVNGLEFASQGGPEGKEEYSETSIKPTSNLPMPFMPAGMPYGASKPIQRARPEYTKMEVKVRRPIAENIKPCNGLHLPQHSGLLQNSCTRVNSPVLAQQSNSQPNLTTVASGSTMNRSRAFLLKAALERSKCSKKEATQETKSQSPSLDNPVDTTNVVSPVHENDEDIKELLQLASASAKVEHTIASEENVPKMLKLSKLAQLIEEGRVLVRSNVPHLSIHNFKDFPFELSIHEALNSFGFEKPKTIQAYVWDAILRGHNVAYISGARGGKTLGYLIPILNNLLDPSEYSEVPEGCSPLAIVICSSWENAEMVHYYCCRIMKKTPNFRSAVFTDGTERSLKVALPYLINGVTLLAATAPALSLLLSEGKDIISFDRCCHLVFDDADFVLKEHAGAAKKLFNFYQESVQRVTEGKNFVPRQIVACASHWTKGMEEISSKVLKNPSVFISSCMEAAIYGGMKLDVRLGTSDEMDCHLLEIMQKKRLSRTIIFCRGSAEVFKVERMLSTIGVAPLLAHNQSIVSDLDFITQRWNHVQKGSAILICTDDVLERLDIKNAQTLIHYFIPHHSKYDFSYRLSFAMDNFHLKATEADKPETHLLITKEFNNSLLTIVRFMQRFGHVVSDELATEAILSFCGKEVRKRNLPLCENLKAFGLCRNMKLCGLRHVILESLDQPVVPRNGIVRIRITAVRTATQYYARILKHRNENNQLEDKSGSHFEVIAQLRNHFLDENERKNPVHGDKIEVGNLYARRTTEHLFDRVRVESVLEKDHQGIPTEVAVVCIDQGCVVQCFVKDIFELPEHLKKIAPEAIEVFLVGAKPLERNSSWSRYANDFVREKLMSKELEGRIVLALSSTLWLSPLHERKRLDGLNSCVVVTDILKELLKAELAESNDEHLVKLHHLCETGGLVLPDCSVGLASRSSKPIEVAHAFLPMNEETQVELVASDSPHQFYVTIVKFQKTLISLEEDIKKQLSKCKNVTYEEARVGSFCLAESPTERGSWCRCCIKKKIIGHDASEFQVFFVDYGDFATVPIHALKTLPAKFISRLPFQAIACSLYGVGPKNDSGGWTEEDVFFFSSLTTGPDGFMHVWHAQMKFKETVPDEVTNGPHYHVTLINREESEPQNLAQQMIAQNYAISLENDEDFRAIVRHSAAIKKEAEEKALREKMCKSQQLSDTEDDMKFDVSPGWIDLFPKSQESDETKSNADSRPSDEASSKSVSASEEKLAVQQIIHGNQNLALIDHTMPLKDSLSRFPTTKWAQSEQDVCVTFVVGHLSDYTIELSENHLSFVADVNGSRYELNTSTYGFIVPEKCSHCIVSCGVKATLRKQGIGSMWTRFIQSPLKQPWLTRDFDYWLTNNSSDDEEQLEPIVDAKYAFDAEQPESSSSDSDEECTDEKWLRDDD